MTEKKVSKTDSFYRIHYAKVQAFSSRVVLETFELHGAKMCLLLVLSWLLIKKISVCVKFYVCKVVYMDGTSFPFLELTSAVSKLIRRLAARRESEGGAANIQAKTR